MNNSLPNKRKRPEIPKVSDKDRFIEANGFNNKKFTVDTAGFEPVKSMRITPITDTTSLYSTGNIETNNETNNEILSHEIRGDYSPAVGSTPNYGKETYHRNMFKDDSSYIPQSSYTPLLAKERSDLLNNMPLKRKHGAGKTKKKNNKKSKKNKSKRKKIMRKIHSKKQGGGGKTRKNKKSKRKTRK
jgi:hypothetical protein